MDASVGLTFSLRLFQRYRRSGVLQAEIRHMPGIQGVCTAYIRLTEGSVTACYLEDKQGGRFSFSVEDLCRADRERGPFAWVFQQQSPLPRSQIAAQPFSNPSLAFTDPDAAIPGVVAQLRWEQFNHWTPEQRRLLQDVWRSIDGKCTLRDIKARLPYPPQAIYDVIQILLDQRIIVLTS